MESSSTDVSLFTESIPTISSELEINHAENDMETYIGVDGGGTSTVAICVDAKFRKIKHCKLETSCNPNSVGMDNAIQTIATIIRSVKVYNVKAIGLGLAGMTSFDKEKLRSTIWEHFKDENHKNNHSSNNYESTLPPIYIESDAYAGLAAAFIPEGLVLISGTGVNCSGYIIKGKERQLIRAAAWGPLLGDSGSGYWIAQQSLIRLCRWVDGMIGDESNNEDFDALKNLIFTKLGVNSMEELVKWVYSDMAWSRIASLTKLVVENSKNNRVCASITNDAGEKLSEYVKCIAKKFKSSKELKLVLVGSVITSPDSPVRDSLRKHLEGTSIEMIITDRGPEVGSAWFAYYFLNSNISP